MDSVYHNFTNTIPITTYLFYQALLLILSVSRFNAPDWDAVCKLSVLLITGSIWDCKYLKNRRLAFIKDFLKCLEAWIHFDNLLSRRLTLMLLEGHRRIEIERSGVVIIGSTQWLRVLMPSALQTWWLLLLLAVGSRAVDSCRHVCIRIAP